MSHRAPAQVRHRRIHGRDVSQGAGRELAQKRTSSGGPNGGKLGRIDGCFLRLHIPVNHHQGKVRPRSFTENLGDVNVKSCFTCCEIFPRRFMPATARYRKQKENRLRSPESEERPKNLRFSPGKPEEGSELKEKSALDESASRIRRHGGLSD